MKQTVIAADQVLNTLVPPYSGDDRGWADETLSSRTWRLSHRNTRWERFRKIVDWVFLKLFREKDHCFDSWISERLLRQMPPELRNTQEV